MLDKRSKAKLLKTKNPKQLAAVSGLPFRGIAARRFLLSGGLFLGLLRVLCLLRFLVMLSFLGFLFSLGRSGRSVRGCRRSRCCRSLGESGACGESESDEGCDQFFHGIESFLRCS